MDIDKGLLKSSIKTLNGCGLAKFQVDLKQPLESLISDFMSAVETIPTEKEDELPESIVEMYNSLADNKTIESGFDIADAALAARNKKEELEMAKVTKEKVVKEKPVKEAKVKVKKTKLKDIKPVKEKPVKEKKVKEVKEKPVKEKVIKEKPAKEPKPVGIVVRPGTKLEMAVQAVREKPGTTMYELKQKPWNDKNDEYRNKFKEFIEKGYMRKEGKGYFINKGF